MNPQTSLTILLLLFHRTGGGTKDNTEESQDDSLTKKDKWNLSNDDFYDPKKSNPDSISLSLVGTILQVRTV